jgi:hypothetical protein
MNASAGGAMDGAPAGDGADGPAPIEGVTGIRIV